MISVNFQQGEYKKPSKIKRFIFSVILLPLFVLALKLILKNLFRIIQERQQVKRYKKIIKKGLFWDTEYLIERD